MREYSDEIRNERDDTKERNGEERKVENNGEDETQKEQQVGM
jgi:hypothetical protein